jgi:hypothetical protein
VTAPTLRWFVTGTTADNPGTARRGSGRPDDDKGVTHPQVRPDPAFGLLELYDDALPHVYGYLLARCGDVSLAEELTAESFLAAVHAVRKPGAPDPSVPWLIGVARHLDRSVHATEALLVRARAAFRRICEGEEDS